MKKQLLLTVMAAGAVMVSAQVPQVNAPVKIDKNFSLVGQSQKMQVFKKGDVVTPAPNYAASNARLSYQRPAGQFYYCPYVFNVDGYWMPGGGMVLTPYTDLTFKNLSSMPNENGYSWLYSEFDQEAGGWAEREDKSFDHVQSFINNYVPGALTLKYSSFTFGDKSYRYASNKYTDYDQTIFPTSNSAKLLEDFGDELYDGIFKEGTLMLSPKYFGAGTRMRNNESTGGFVYYTGAGESGEDCWFGKGSPYGAIATRYEKPDAPYILKGVYIYGLWTTKAPVKFQVKVYNVTEDGYFGTDENGEETNFPAVLGDLICEGEVDVISGSDDENPWQGFLECKFTETEDGVVYEYEPEITESIMVVVENINDPNITTGSLLVSTDPFDEGHGNLGFLGHPAVENPTEDKPVMFGLTHFFTSGVLQTAPTIFINAERGWILNAEGNGDEWLAPNEGATKELILRSSTASEDGMRWEPTLENGDALPDWLAINMADYYDQDVYTGLITAEITVDPLPEGVTGRTATVKFAFPGASYTYVVNQGDTQGAVEIVGTDAEIVSSKYFDLQGREIKNVPENGVFIQQSTLTDGSVKSVKVVR